MSLRALQAPAARAVRVGAAAARPPAEAKPEVGPAPGKPAQPQKVMFDVLEKNPDVSRVSAPLPPKVAQTTTTTTTATFNVGAHPTPTSAAVKPAGRKSLFAQRFDAAQSARPAPKQPPAATAAQSDPRARAAPAAETAAAGLGSPRQGKRHMSTESNGNERAPRVVKFQDEDEHEEDEGTTGDDVGLDGLGSLPDVTKLSGSQIAAAHDELRSIFSPSSLAFLQKRARERAGLEAPGAPTATTTTTTTRASVTATGDGRAGPAESAVYARAEPAITSGEAHKTASAPSLAFPASAPGAPQAKPVTKTAFAAPAPEPSPYEVCGFEQPTSGQKLREPGSDC
jgi:hypothetical protein